MSIKDYWDTIFGKISNYMLIEDYWYTKKLIKILYILYPFEILYRIIIFIRKMLYKYNIFKTYKFNLPIIVVGNLTVGGTGKTPMVIYLANYLQSQGFKVAVITRGYGAKYLQINRIVSKNAAADLYGDEAVMLANKLACPVVIGKNRIKSVQYLLANYQIDLIISDDGLQHYALHRDLNIIMLDAERSFGNQHLLPLGPLRTSIAELHGADFIMLNQAARGALTASLATSISLTRNYHSNVAAVNDDSNLTTIKQITSKVYKVHLVAQQLVNLTMPTVIKAANEFNHDFHQVHAVAGIGNNQKFFNLLNSLNIATINHSFPDHHRYICKDVDFNDDLPIVMTEKDAVKCSNFANNKLWQLSVTLKIDDADKFHTKLLNLINH